LWAARLAFVLAQGDLPPARQLVCAPSPTARQGLLARQPLAGIAEAGVIVRSALAPGSALAAQPAFARADFVVIAPKRNDCFAR